VIRPSGKHSDWRGGVQRRANRVAPPHLACMSFPDAPPRIHTRRTARTARYALLGTDPAAAQRVWFVLHGYAQLAPRFLRPFMGLVPHGTCIVAPEGLSRFYVDMPRADGSHLQRVGATWMTREAREDDIADTMSWLDALHEEMTTSARSATVGLLAFSQGVATATRWLAHGRIAPAAFVAWAGGPAHDIDEGALSLKLADAAVTLVCGDQDALIADSQRDDLLATLQRWQPRTALITFSGGHHLDPVTLAPLLDSLPRR
jgi:dienelactone hydrolase